MVFLSSPSGSLALRYTMKAIVLVIYWFLILAIIGSIVFLQTDITSARFLGYARLFLPMFALVLLFPLELILHFKLKDTPGMVLRRLLAVPFLTFGMNWFAIFTLTNYRSHHRMIAIPLAIIFLAIGFGLIHFRIYIKSEYLKK